MKTNRGLIIITNWQIIENVKECVYLDHAIQFCIGNQTTGWID